MATAPPEVSIADHETNVEALAVFVSDFRAKISNGEVVPLITPPFAPGVVLAHLEVFMPRARFPLIYGGTDYSPHITRMSQLGWWPFNCTSTSTTWVLTVMF